ncbi:MAG: hypothetical protein JST94_02080 [Bacteroidetes bacterium]|nr:hypothetical protein [Bacteroidota bacterium]MBS1639792.1 hypothetical protein [Bacteroidota bacterium]MBS1642576.1 hypothetical protein [Bacteroidota bacterium]MBS1670234.1 hypothetical protein [Bacteroidota bacterium]
MKKIFNTTQTEKILTLLILMLVLTNIVNAQPPDLGGDVDAPIDGGLSLLIAGGVGYGIKKAKEISRKKKQE